ncbi:MAG: hypothetical protein ACK5UG_03220 [Synechococcaceae cyanobacterium]
MLQLPVAMVMGMPKGAISRVPLQILLVVFVLVMGVAAVWIVAVAMGMVQGLMVMEVAVLLPQQQHDACGHQPRSQEQGR